MIFVNPTMDSSICDVCVRAIVPYVLKNMQDFGGEPYDQPKEKPN